MSVRVEFEEVGESMSAVGCPLPAPASHHAAKSQNFQVGGLNHTNIKQSILTAQAAT